MQRNAALPWWLTVSDYYKTKVLVATLWGHGCSIHGKRDAPAAPGYCLDPPDRSRSPP